MKASHFGAIREKLAAISGARVRVSVVVCWSTHTPVSKLKRDRDDVIEPVTLNYKIQDSGFRG